MKVLHGKRTIDAKYHIEIRNREGEGSAPMLIPVIVNTKTGKVLEEDEPMILFRGQDQLVRPLLTYYSDLCARRGSPWAQLHLIGETFDKFDKFADSHPDRLKIPD